MEVRLFRLVKVSDYAAPAFPPPSWGRDEEGGKLRALNFQNTPLPTPAPCASQIFPTCAPIGWPTSETSDVGRGREPTAYAAALCFILTIFAGVTSPASAADIKAGRQKALQCQTCHGLDGLSKIPDAPNIAGSPETYLARQLDAFRKGGRKNEMMSVVAQPLSDQDVADLAAYYSAIEVTAKPPK